MPASLRSIARLSIIPDGGTASHYAAVGTVIVTVGFKQNAVLVHPASLIVIPSSDLCLSERNRVALSDWRAPDVTLQGLKYISANTDRSILAP
jgi:hypothetical protein